MLVVFLCTLLAGPPDTTKSEAPAPPPTPTPKPDSSPPALSILRARSIGPAVTSGRIVSIAVHPKDSNTYFVAAASGGVWKTTNDGTTWTPVFDAENSYSIGCVTIDPQNPNVVWVGTGENNSQRSVGYGDGVYKSVDGGKTWRNAGLKSTEHIARILIDPRDSDVVYVAAQGPLWGPGGERGLYKTTDGGKTWDAILTLDENTGVTDLVQHPTQPDTLIAATYQRRRHVHTLINGGPGSGLRRTTDGGKTWQKVTSGLPGGELGRIGLALAPTDPDTIYASVESIGDAGGIFCSTDRGLTWDKRNPFDEQAQYYAHIVVDPHDKNRVYVMNVRLLVSNDGGRTLAPLGERAKHVDNHCIWVDPANLNHMRVGCDGGLYTSTDRGQHWRFHANLPVTQFYDCAVDQNPESGPFYHVYGGTQDNFTLGGPVRTRSSNGITNADWFVVQGGDGFHCAVDPTDSNIVYGEYQYGGLCRFDRKTGTRVDIQPLPAPGEPPLRWNWDSPLVLSPHNPKRLYFAANRLFRSDDRGDSWAPVSPDLTRQLNRDELAVFGKIPTADAVAKHLSTSFYGNITALAESPKAAGHLFVGTDDGLIQVSTNGGETWTKFDTFPGVPERTYVAKLVASQHDANTVYAAFDNHKNADFKPYLLKSTDSGQTWKSLSETLPERGTVYCLAEDHVTPDLLFCGTEFGLYMSTNGGQKWDRIRSGLPTIQVKDLAIQWANNDLVIATFGRGFYVIDDYSPLRTVTPDLLAQPAAVMAPAKTMLYIPGAQYGSGGQAFQGSAFYMAPNPSVGTTLVVHLKNGYKTKKQLRKEAEKAAEKAGNPPPVPTPDELRAEEEDEAPSVQLIISDPEQEVRRVLAVSSGAGLHRVAWDLREAGAATASDSANGPLVTPGTYFATLIARSATGAERLADPVKLTVTADPLAGLSDADYAQIAAFNKETRVLRRQLAATMSAAADLASRLEQVKAALDSVPTADESANKKVREVIVTVRESRRRLGGDSVLARRNMNVPVSIRQRVSAAAYANYSALAVPTGTQKTAAADAAKELAAEIEVLKPIEDTALPELLAVLKKLNVPLPAGKLPTE